MDWLKMFTLLVAVAAVHIKAEGPKKKIRIHLPQKVKHIHHHKKIYITHHPAPSQYAPAYLPRVRGVVTLPSNHARPSVGSIVPFNSVELYDETRSRLPGVVPSASKLLPLYHARGHYGPNYSEWDEQEYDLSPPPETNFPYAPSDYVAGLSKGHPLAPAPPKKIKIIKINDHPQKKKNRKVKPKQVIYRNRPQPLIQPPPEEELPVSSFHEKFYSDLEEAGTIRKIEKPPRIEKIIDGDTEHIHSYSEEHIHKIVFDDDSKVGADPPSSMSALNAALPLLPLKNAQTFEAFRTGPYTDLTVMGSMGTPSHLEYDSYNPRDVTHDHVFHNHGEIPPGMDINKENFRLPPKVSFNSHGLRVTGDTSKRYHYYKRYHNKSTKPTHDFSYYESMYNPSPSYTSKKVPRPTISTSHYESSPDTTINEFRPIPVFRFKDKQKAKTRTYGHNKSVSNSQLQQASVPAPFSVSSSIVHDYDPKHYAELSVTPTGFSKQGDHLINFSDSYSNDFDYDTYASSSNIYTSADKTDSNVSQQGIGKKSVSTQNINFGGPDRQTFLDHLASSSSSNLAVSIEPSPTALESFSSEFDKTAAADLATPTPFTIKKTSPAHQYYAAMALQALHSEEPEASNDNMQYAELPTPATEPTESSTTTSQIIHFYKIQSTDAIPKPDYISETRISKKRREKRKGDHRQRYNTVFKKLVSGYKDSEQQTWHSDSQHFHSTDSTSNRENPKYGDKI